MFFIYKKTKKQLPLNEFNLAKNMSNKPLRVLILTFDIQVIRNFILPIKFVLKEFQYFLLFYRFQSVRSYPMMKFDLKVILRKQEAHSLVIPTKGMRQILHILVLFKLSFHFFNPITNYRISPLINSKIVLRSLYGILRLNYLNFLLSNKL
jgi:hypothetical protein